MPALSCLVVLDTHTKKKKNNVIQPSKSKWEIKTVQNHQVLYKFCSKCQNITKKGQFLHEIEEIYLFIIKGEHFDNLCKIMRIA